MMNRYSLMAIAAIVLAACGSASGDATTLDVAQLASGGALDSAVVEGFVVWDDTDARLCQSLMESFPAQCGGPSVAISNPDEVGADFGDSGGVRWTASPVILTGQFDGTQFTVE